MSTIQNSQFCKQCHSNLQFIHGLLKPGTFRPDLNRVRHECSNLQLLAQSERRHILERYAKDIKTLCYQLEDGKSGLQDRQVEQAVQFGLKCAGCQREQCVEMRFDQLLRLEANMGLTSH